MVWLSCSYGLVLLSTLVLTTSSLSNPSQSGGSLGSPGSGGPLWSGGPLGSGGPLWSGRSLRSGGPLRSGGEERRQLGDMEFSSRYAEYLRAQAKLSSLCTFLRRMQAVRTSAANGEEEKLSELLTQYRCPGSVTWTSDL